MGFDTTTLMLLVILGPIIFFLGWIKPFAALSVLVLLLPFRDFSIRVLNAFTEISIGTVNSISRWWFVFILALLAVWVGKGVQSIWKQRVIPKPGVLDVLIAIIIILGVLEAFFSPNRMAGITSLRGYLQPLVVFVLARSFLPSSKKELKYLHIAFLVVGVTLLAVAIWQLSWTEEMYKTWGHVDQVGRLTGLAFDMLNQERVRPPSTVSGPNELGVLFLIVFYLSIQWLIFGARKERWIMAVLSLAFLAGIALTLSRSVFLGFLVSGFVFFVYLIRKFGSSLREYNRRRWASILLIVGLVLIVIIVVMSAIGMFEIVMGTLRSLSRQDHIIDSLEAIRDIARDPAGVGMGMVWPKGAAILRDTEALYHVEGSIFQIAFEWGIWGLVLWLIFIGICLWRIWKGWNRTHTFQIQINSGTVLLGWVGGLITFIFLPLMQSVSLMVLLWFLLGLGVGLEKMKEELSP